MTIETFPDVNHNGVPDVFEQRRAISDILNDDEPRPTIVMEIETRHRTPRKGELFLCAGCIEMQEYDIDNESYKFPIVRIISGNYKDLEQVDREMPKIDLRDD